MKETDLRVIKTKKALSSSLLQLLDQQLFQTITVNQICDNALVHRTTFYKHFYDKYDLLEYLFNQLPKDYFARAISDRLIHPFQTMSDTVTAISSKVVFSQLIESIC
uniref:TetR/AcrR family transcriptional regulator n=1 Tax=Staphylococcus aureus TaxID=1280 RepID=UPI00210CA7E2